MKRYLYLFLFALFALILPLVALDWQFSFAKFSEQTTSVQIGIGGVIAVLIILSFFRKWIVTWAKSFDKVSVTKGFFRWLVFVFPSAFLLGFTLFATMLGEKVLPFIAYTTVFHTIAGIFLVLAEKEKVERFKRWVRK